jgi:hypothetical protein
MTGAQTANSKHQNLASSQKSVSFSSNIFREKIDKTAAKTDSRISRRLLRYVQEIQSFLCWKGNVIKKIYDGENCNLLYSLIDCFPPRVSFKVSPLKIINIFYLQIVDIWSLGESFTYRL